MKDKIFVIKKNLNEKGVFLYFSGPISQDFLVEIGHTLRQKMELEKVSRSIIVKVFSVFIEHSQNIINFSAEQCNSDIEGSPTAGIGVIVVGFDGDNYFVSCGNTIHNSDVDIFNDILSRIKDMGKEKLKEYYKEELKKEVSKKSDGPGLSLIEVARKSGRPIEYKLTRIDEKHTFLTVKTVV